MAFVLESTPSNHVTARLRGRDFPKFPNLSSSTNTPLPHNIMPPKKKSAPAITKTLVLDNGAYTLKAGLVPTNPTSSPSYDDCSVIPNCIARSDRDRITYTASELDNCKDFGELKFRRPVEKGFIVNWEAEKAIWEHEFMDAREGLTVGTPMRTSIRK